jgi:hypothetical protein
MTDFFKRDFGSFVFNKFYLSFCENVRCFCNLCYSMNVPKWFKIVFTKVMITSDLLSDWSQSARLQTKTSELNICLVLPHYVFYA